MKLLSPRIIKNTSEKDNNNNNNNKSGSGDLLTTQS
jgi:hypothetical protein